VNIQPYAGGGENLHRTIFKEKILGQPRKKNKTLNLIFSTSRNEATTPISIFPAEPRTSPPLPLQNKPENHLSPKTPPRSLFLLSRQNQYATGLHCFPHFPPSVTQPPTFLLCCCFPQQTLRPSALPLTAVTAPSLAKTFPLHTSFPSPFSRTLSPPFLYTEVTSHFPLPASHFSSFLLPFPVGPHSISRPASLSLPRTNQTYPFPWRNLD